MIMFLCFLLLATMLWVQCYRAVASYVTTVNQLYISLLILGYFRYLPRLVWQKSGRLYSELRSERSLELKLLLC